MSYWYLATPYAAFPGGICEAFEEAAKQAAIVLRAGVPVFSPIAHSHPIARHGVIDPYDHGVWLKADDAFIEAATGCIVCMMDGWDRSFGVNYEVEAFVARGKPVIYMEPGKVPEEVVARHGAELVPL